VAEPLSSLPSLQLDGTRLDQFVYKSWQARLLHAHYPFTFLILFLILIVLAIPLD